jgi:hypothetical protein
MNKVVVHTALGEVIKGYTGDFASHKPSFLLSSEEGKLRMNQIIELKTLKAVFFVKTFDGNFLHRMVHDFEDITCYGKKVAVVFQDGEKLFGRVETLHYDPEHSGFFLFPLDPNSNTIRVFVLNSFIVSVEIPE